MRDVSGHGGRRSTSPVSSAAMMSTRVASALRGLRAASGADAPRRSLKKRATSAAHATGCRRSAAATARACAPARDARQNAVSLGSIACTHDQRHQRTTPAHMTCPLAHASSMKIGACQRLRTLRARQRRSRCLVLFGKAAQAACANVLGALLSTARRHSPSTLLGVERQDHRLDRADRRRRHRQRAEAEPDQRHAPRAAGRPSRRTASAAPCASSPPSPASSAPAAAPATSTSKRLATRALVRSAANRNCIRSLRADRDEIDLRQKRVELEQQRSAPRSWRRRDASWARRCPCFVEERLLLVDQRARWRPSRRPCRDHRDHDAQFAPGRRLAAGRAPAVRNSAGRSSAMRIARQPMAGFSSFGWRR